MILTKMGKKPKNCSYLGGYFTSYLLSQLFVTHLGVALLFLHNSLLISLLCISALLLRYTLSRLLVNFHKNRMGDDVIMTSFNIRFLQTIVHISNSIEPTNYVLGTNTQQHNVHLMIKMKVTLTDDEEYRWRSKVTKNELMVISRKLLHSQTSHLVTRYNTTSDI